MAVLTQDLEVLIEASQRAALEVLRLRDLGLQIVKKADGTPVTNADRAAHDIVVAAIRGISASTIISEEGDIPLAPPEELRHGEYWLIDPIDGTRDFLRGEDGFAICIAKVVNRKPVLGLLAAPGMNKLYFARTGEGSFAAQLDQGGRAARVIRHPLSERGLIAGASRSSPSGRLREVYSLFGINEIKQMGSAVKFAHLAMGDFDLVPRFGLTFEWDTAAGQIIAEEAGCRVLDLETLAPLEYGKRAWENDAGFIAIRSDRIEPAQMEKLREMRRAQVLSRLFGGGA